MRWPVLAIPFMSSVAIAPSQTRRVFAQEAADTSLSGGPILTLCDDADHAETVVVKDGYLRKQLLTGPK